MNKSPAFSDRRLFVGNLPKEIDARLLSEAFGRFGRVTETHLVLDDNKRFRGYAFVTLETPEAAQAAIRALNGRAVAGKKLTVELATQRADPKKRSEDRGAPPRSSAPERRAR